MRKAHNLRNFEKNEPGCLFLTGTAVPPLAWAVPTFWTFPFFFAWMKARPCHHRHGPCHHRHGPCHHRHRPCQPSGFWGLKIFLFLESVLDDYLQNNEKQTKRKAIKCVGCLPRSALLMSLAWRRKEELVPQGGSWRLKVACSSTASPAL